MESLVFHLVLMHLKECESNLKEQLIYLQSRSLILSSCLDEHFGSPLFYEVLVRFERVGEAYEQIQQRLLETQFLLIDMEFVNLQN
jgi:hypothetical protein